VFTLDGINVQLQSVFRNGKNSFASIAYEMTVNHTKRFHATTIGHYGTTSDKTIVKFDGFVNQVCYNELFTEAEFKLQVGENLLQVGCRERCIPFSGWWVS
jgi:hypothetical protein